MHVSNPLLQSPSTRTSVRLRDRQPRDHRVEAGLSSAPRYGPPPGTGGRPILEESARVPALLRQFLLPHALAVGLQCIHREMLGRRLDFGIFKLSKLQRCIFTRVALRSRELESGVLFPLPSAEPYCSPRMHIENNLTYTRSCATLTYNFKLLLQDNFGMFKLPTLHRCIFMLYPCLPCTVETGVRFMQ